MIEQLVTFETAKLAKEKGFTENCVSYYNKSKELENHIDGVPFSNFDYKSKWFKTNFPNNISASTQSLLQRWLREKHKINIIIYPNSGNEGDEEEVWYYSYVIRFDNALDDDSFSCMSDKESSSYEIALELALLETLETLDFV